MNFTTKQMPAEIQTGFEPGSSEFKCNWIQQTIVIATVTFCTYLTSIGGSKLLTNKLMKRKDTAQIMSLDSLPLGEEVLRD